MTRYEIFFRGPCINKVIIKIRQSISGVNGCLLKEAFWEAADVGVCQVGRTKHCSARPLDQQLRGRKL